MWGLLVPGLWHGHIIVNRGIALRQPLRRLSQGHDIVLAPVHPNFSFSFRWLLLLVVVLPLFFQGGFWSMSCPQSFLSALLSLSSFHWSNWCRGWFLWRRGIPRWCHLPWYPWLRIYGRFLFLGSLFWRSLCGWLPLLYLGFRQHFWPSLVLQDGFFLVWALSSVLDEWMIWWLHCRVVPFL